LEIDALDAELKEMLSVSKNRTAFMVFHPSWGYFAQSYGLKQVPVEIEGKAPKPKELERLIRYAKTKKIKSIFVQPQFPTRGAKIIADAIGGQVFVADPLAEQWADNLRRVALQLTKALR
jgi:zinc transport system substrate-binding protein